MVETTGIQIQIEKRNNGIEVIVSAYHWEQFVRSAKGIFGHVSRATGVDIGTSLMKAVVLQKDRYRHSLADFSLQSVCKTNNPDEQSFAGLIESLREKIEIPFGTMGTSLSGASVFVKSMILPTMTEKDLREHLNLELDRYIACNVEDVYWDVHRPNPRSQVTAEQQEHVLVVAKKECVERRVDAFCQDGMTLRFVDVDAFALVNLVVHNYGREGASLLTHIGPTGMVLVVIVDGEPVGIQKIPYDAEWYGEFFEKMFIGETSSEQRKTRKNLEPSEALLLEKFGQEIHERICEIWESFSDRVPPAKNRRILLSGGYAVAPGIASIVAQFNGDDVQLLDPFQSITIPLRIQQDVCFQYAAPLMGVAVGMALRGPGHD